MKVAFLIHSMEASSSRYRVVQYLPILKAWGVDHSVHFHKRRWRDKVKLYDTLGQYDLVFILRKLFSPPEFWFIRNRSKRIVYDFDDAVMYRSSGSRSPYSLSRRTRFAYMMPRIDRIVAGNEFLKSEALRYNSRVTVIPTSIDLSRYSLKEEYPKDGRVTIGWLGSSSTLRYLETLMPALERVHRSYPDLQLKIVSDRFVDSPALPVIKKPWSSEDEVSDLKSFDIGIMPLTDDPWSKGKCSLKILQYGSVGIPVICSPVGMNRETVKDKVNGYWAENERQWEERLLELILDKERRREMGLRGRMTVEQGYSLEVNAPRMLSVLKEAVQNKRFNDQ